MSGVGGDFLKQPAHSPAEGAGLLRSYRAYGLEIESELELPELESGVGPAEVLIRRGHVEDPPDQFDENGWAAWLRGDTACHHVRGTVALLVRQGREIVVDVEEGAFDDTVRLSILGPAMGLLLEQRGAFVLHGSAIDVGGRAIVMVGPHGVGKSTLAALFRSRGHTLITDDVCPLLLTSAGVVVVPTYAQIKLWPDAVERFGMTPQSLPRVHPALDKRALRDVSTFSKSSMPLHRIYVLGRAPDVEVLPVNAQDGFKALLQNWYPVRFGSGFLAKTKNSDLFARSSAVAAAVTMRILHCPTLAESEASAADRVEQAVLADLAAG